MSANNRTVLQIVAIVVAIAAAAAVFNVMNRWDASPTKKRTAEIGAFQNVTGQVERRPALSVDFESINGPRPLYNQDLVVTQKGASATLSFQSGTSIRVNESSRFIAELDPAHPETVLGTVLDGEVSVLSAGPRGSFRLLRDGRDLPLDRPNTALVPIIPAGGAPPAATNAAEPTPGLVVSATLPDEAATPSPRAQSPEPEGTLSNDVLTNDDIVRQLRAQTGFFQRCYLNFIHRKQEATTAKPNVPGGTIVVGFVVQPTGKVTEAKIVKTDFQDPTFSNCITEVIERTRFKGFRGEKPVPVQEFPISLQ